MVCLQSAPTSSLPGFQRDLQTLVQRHLSESGALLIRGFEVPSSREFREFTSWFGLPLLSYDYGSTPRQDLGEGLYTSTEYPAHQRIPLHNEQAYTRQWPAILWFYCETPPQEDGETPIADSRAVYRQLDPEVRETFERKGLMYVRNYSDGLDVAWRDVFRTDERAEVEAFCHAQGIECEWGADDALRTRQTCQVSARHPKTGVRVWFNQAHLFHVSALAPQLRQLLVSTVGEAHLPRNVYHADGTPIDEAHLDHIRAVYEANSLRFPWRQGDILMLDNMLYAHGRNSYKGDRRIVVAMAGALDEHELR
ncbi:TauD/TfdA family dioxygenase [Sulfidibacter corallicola]|uniref:TauD/TfdA family dioxygenase n=1 Tax=Sulfidibacter corallicola TaxID=2818388 RepID=A0A8A4TH15_SULCO|nr:TauD/TfdA family dioxygenase [Sulfidibacter corallicola]QTD48807.1 TauD/TfdA family dioxygenase [Sulfidibacter corallicola]